MAGAQAWQSLIISFSYLMAYDRFAILAIKFSAIGYFLKPVDTDDLQEALNKLKETSIENTGLMAGVVENNLRQPVKKKDSRYTLVMICFF
jgi:DNA-binding LytR/AlgR family response regulator